MHSHQSSHQKRLLGHHKLSPVKEIFHIAETNDRPVIVKHPDATGYSISKPHQIEVDPVSFTAGAFTNNAIQFRIQKDLCSEIEMVFVELDCTETGGANTVTPVPAPYLIQDVRIYYGAMGRPYQTIDSDSLYTQFNWASAQENVDFLALNALNMTKASYSNETALSASGSSSYSIPLLFSVLNGMNPKLMKKDIIVEVRPRANPVSAGTGVLQLTDIRLRIITKDPLHDMSIRELHNKHSFLFPYCEPVVFEQTQMLTASTQADITVQLEGNYAAWLVLNRASKAVASSAIRTFSAIGGAANLEYRTGVLDILDKSKVSIFGSGALRPAFFRTQLPAMLGSDDQSSVVATYWCVFAADHENFAEVLKNGLKSHGGLSCDNDHTVFAVSDQENDEEPSQVRKFFWLLHIVSSNMFTFVENRRMQNYCLSGGL